MELNFRPLPLLGNAHLQTLLGHVLPGPDLHEPTHLALVSLPDGDRLVLHDTKPRRWPEGGPIAVLVHGMGGTYRSAYIRRMALLLLQRNVRVVRLDLRGSGRGIALARIPYCGGCSADMRAAVTEVHRWSQASPIALIGFSLGGNIVLKMAGEAANDPVPGLTQVIAVAPPIDLVACAEMLAQPHNRYYEQAFVRDLTTLYSRRLRLFPHQPRIRFPAPLTIRGFDDHFTAPTWGFASAVDYYRKSSSLPLVPEIRVPTLIVTAKDDPFVVVEPFQKLKTPDNVRIHVLDRGGHLGFLGWDGRGGIRWLERRIADWVHPPRRLAS